jgi:hypothetical protein
MNVADGGSMLVVFVASQVYTGNLGGLSGADAKCQGLANAAGVTGTFKAWLSDRMTAASSRLSHGSVPYALVDRTVVAPNWSGLTSGTLVHAIDETESGAPPPTTPLCEGGVGHTAWTNTLEDGSKIGPADCNKWGSSTAGMMSGGVGSADRTTKWSNDCTLSCSQSAALLCIQQ